MTIDNRNTKTKIERSINAKVQTKNKKGKGVGSY